MRVHVYTLTWNEEIFLPYFLRHYSFADKIVVYDNMSTDRTPEIVRSFPNTVLRFYNSNNTIDERAYLHIKGECWKEDRSPDWVIACDSDELVYHPQLDRCLERLSWEGHGVVYCKGYDMVSDKPPSGPVQAWEEIRHGVPTPWYDKAVLFNPGKVADMNYTPGCHLAFPSGNDLSVVHHPELKLLHYHNLGEDYLVERYDKKKPRSTEERVWFSYREDISMIRNRLADLRGRLEEVVPVRDSPF